MAEKNNDVKHKIDKIETTNDCLSSRAGLSLVVRYIKSTRICHILAKIFAFVKKTAKGTGLLSLFLQLICFFFDGSNLRLTHFDKLKNDEGYAASIETAVKQMASSHTIKRFFRVISKVRVWLFRKVLKQLFIWRLGIEKPKLIKIGLDTMVMDNDDALKKEGVEPTYKKVKGFQPLQMYWGRYIIDAIFRNGKAHSNHGNHAIRMVKEIVKLIRKHYSKDVPIILMADTGFFDNKLFTCSNLLHIGFVIGGKMYADVKECIVNHPDEEFFEYTKNKKTWLYCEFMDKRKSWDSSWRMIYTKPISDDEGQILLEFARPETIIYTNIGMDNFITKAILAVKETKKTTISPQAIITLYHQRGRDELVNRGLKDFGSEQLPFKRFSSNAGFYYMMVISFFLFESFKYDINCEIIPLQWYATTFRRRCLDIAGKIVRTGRQVIMKIAYSAYQMLRFDVLWEKSICTIPLL
jgi:hypothetical protein